MDSYPTTERPGSIAPADGNAAPYAMGAQLWRANTPGTGHEGNAATELGPNKERLAEVKPKLVNALRELVRQYREEGIVARRHEIRRIRQARLFWQGLQYAWWNPMT